MMFKGGGKVRTVWIFNFIVFLVLKIEFISRARLKKRARKGRYNRKRSEESVVRNESKKKTGPPISS